MKYGLLLALAIAMPVNAGTSTWSFSLDGMEGEIMNWYSSTPTNPQADEYEYVFDLNYVGAEVVWLGIVLGHTTLLAILMRIFAIAKESLMVQRQSKCLMTTLKPMAIVMGL